VHEESPVRPLLERAARGNESAWREIVDRFSPLVAAVCRGYGITGPDAEDVAGSVWLRLVSKLDSIREPEALPGWLRSTVRNECRTLLRHTSRQIPTDLIDTTIDPDVDNELIDAERHAAVRAAVRRMPARDLELLSLLFADPPRPYKEISSTLGIPIGAIGPTRARCLARARTTPAIAALLADRRHGPTRPERLSA